jgi:hypothetical protein
VFFMRSMRGRIRTDRWFDRNVPGLGQASIKGEWQFQRGKRGALLIMHNPRQEYVPRGRILEALYKVPELKDMHIVNSIFKCPAYTIYLSDKSMFPQCTLYVFILLLNTVIRWREDFLGTYSQRA